MKRVAMLLVAAGCSQGTAKGPKEPAPAPPPPALASAQDAAAAAPSAAAPPPAPTSAAPDEPEFWRRDGVKACEGAGGTVYEYDDAYGCQIDGDPVTLSLRFDGQGRLVGIERFGAKIDGSAKLEGISVETYPGGGRRTEQLYHRGVADGPTTHYHPNGAKALEGRFVQDRPEGRFVGWDGNGKELGSFEIAAGTGEWTEWYADGKPQLKKALRDGAEHGEHREWFEDGSAKLQVRFADGKEVGLEKRWQRPNVLAREGAWADGEQVGVWRFYTADGKLDRLETYAAGELRSIAPYQDGKPVGALGKPGRCAADLEGEMKRQQKRELRHACVREPQLFPGVVVIGEMVHDYGCERPVAYADCDLHKKLGGAALLARAGWTRAKPELKKRLASAYVTEVALAGRGADEPAIEVDAKGTLTLTTVIAPRIGRRGAIGEPTPVTFTITAAGKISQR